jgi:hypothetical protein
MFWFEAGKEFLADYGAQKLASLIEKGVGDTEYPRG